MNYKKFFTYSFIFLFNFYSILAVSTYVEKARELLFTYSQVSYDIFDNITDIYDQLESCYLDKTNIYPSLTKLVCSSIWKVISNSSLLETALKNRIEEHNKKFDFIILDEIDDEKFNDELRMLDQSIIVECKVFDLKPTTSSESSILQLLGNIRKNVELLKTYLKKISSYSTPIDWAKKNLWGSHFSTRILPIFMKIGFPIARYFQWIARNRKFAHDTDQVINDAAAKMLNDAKAVIQYQGGASRDEIITIILQWFWDLYERAQEEDYKDGNDERAKQAQINRVLNRAKIKERSIKFANIIGYEEEKQVLAQVVETLKNPLKFKRLGIKTPAGILFYGPPGTGKTMLARALAGETTCPCWSVNASSLLGSRWISSEDKIRDLFDQAEAQAPSIVFIDELDFIGSRKKTASDSDEKTKALANLLTKLSGFAPRNPYKPVLVIAATNYIEDLDEALIRSGRFDIRLSVGFPDFPTRKMILEKELDNVDLGSGSKRDAILDELAFMVDKKSGADIVSFINKAKLSAACMGKSSPDLDNFKNAMNCL